MLAGSRKIWRECLSIPSINLVNILCILLKFFESLVTVEGKITADASKFSRSLSSVLNSLGGVSMSENK